MVSNAGPQQSKGGEHWVTYLTTRRTSDHNLRTYLLTTHNHGAPACRVFPDHLITTHHQEPERSPPGVSPGILDLASRKERMDEPAVLFGEWPLTLSRNRVGQRIRQLTDSGRVRHDLLVDKNRVGRIIGQRGSTLQALLQVLLC